MHIIDMYNDLIKYLLFYVYTCNLTNIITIVFMNLNLFLSLLSLELFVFLFVFLSKIKIKLSAMVIVPNVKTFVYCF